MLESIQLEFWEAGPSFHFHSVWEQGGSLFHKEAPQFFQVLLALDVRAARLLTQPGIPFCHEMWEQDKANNTSIFHDFFKKNGEKQ